jgi:hypothetical protein
MRCRWQRRGCVSAQRKHGDGRASSSASAVCQPAVVIRAAYDRNGLSRAAAAELRRVAVVDARSCHRGRQPLPSELGIAARAGVTADVHERPNAGSGQRLDELVERSHAVADREDLHGGSLTS